MSIAIESVPVGGSLSSWKRRGSDEEDEVDGPTLLKRTRYSYYFTLESESPVPTDEDEESVYSFQENETDYVRDTSDTSSDSWETDSNIGPYEIEYEVASPYSQNVNEDSLSSSDPEDVIAVSIAAVFCETDDLADNSDDSRSTVDSEIGKADYWTCVQCNTSNNNPLFRYCERCYKERKNFFPPRPKRKRRVRRKEKNASQSSEISISSSQETVKLDKLDSGIGASQGERLNLSLDLVDGNMGSSESEVNTPSSSSQELLEHFDTFDSVSSSGRSQVPSDKLCIVCAANPKNGVFVHGNIVHICCCYKCAVKVWKTNDQKCPLCKRQVTQVLKAFYT